MDGRSIAPLLVDATDPAVLPATREHMQRESAQRDWNFTNYNFVEIFDLDKDPHQLQNLVNSTSTNVKAKLHSLLQAQWECAGQNCEQAFQDLWASPSLESSDDECPCGSSDACTTACNNEYTKTEDQVNCLACCDKKCNAKGDGS